MAGEIMFHSLANRHYPRHDDKTLYRKFLDTLSFGMTDSAERFGNRTVGRDRVGSALEVFREYAESGMTGGLLGFLSAKTNGSMNLFGFPADGAGALAGALVKVVAGRDSHIGRTGGNIGMTCNGIFWFRAADRMARAKKKLEAHGDWSDNPDPQVDDSTWEGDPVLEVGKCL